MVSRAYVKGNRRPWSGWIYCRAIVFLIALALVGLVFIWYQPVIQQNERMRGQVLHLNHQISGEEVLGRQLETATNSLWTNPKAVERLARQNLGYARPGETVIRFEPPPAAR